MDSLIGVLDGAKEKPPVTAGGLHQLPDKVYINAY